MVSPRSQSPEDTPEECPRENPEVIEKMKSMPLDQNRDRMIKYGDEEIKGRDSMEFDDRRRTVSRNSRSPS